MTAAIIIKAPINNFIHILTYGAIGKQPITSRHLITMSKSDKFGLGGNTFESLVSLKPMGINNNLFSDFDVEELQLSTEITALLKKTSINLLDGVDEDHIGLNFEGRAAILTSHLSNRYGRSVQGYESLSITMEEMAELI
jgi:hypothetical protein